MIRTFRDRKEPKNRPRNDANRRKTGSRESDPMNDTYFDDIDPAEFFDPEEFGIRRKTHL